MSDARRTLRRVIAAYAALVALVAVVLYPVMLVCKKAFEPGPHFALSASPVPTTSRSITSRDLFGARGGARRADVPAPRAELASSISLATTVVGVVLSCTAAYALSRFRFPGPQGRAHRRSSSCRCSRRRCCCMPLYVILDKLGLLNSITGLVLVYSTTAIPFCVWTLKGYFDTLPRELEEAARIDGASPWLIFRRIILPLARPGIAVTALFSFMTAWNEFIMASTFMTDESRYTLPVLIQSSVGQYSADWGLFAAGAVVTSMPVMVAFYVLQRYLVGGLTAGAVKG